MHRLAEARINKLTIAGDETLLQGGRKGVEKESLRIDRSSGDIASTPHPRAWGSPLTHPYITTDYSESLPELVTPAFTRVEEVADFLHQLHQYMYATISGNELLWAASMPCAVGDDRAIPIADYGTSNIGRMKHIYRVGLDYRYGRRMQAIAGVHFNYSLPDAFWPVFQQGEGDAGPLREFIDGSYFAMIRNFRRFGWIVPLLFGNSPAVCKSFLAGRTTRFKSFDEGTYYLPYATSLRMSDIGYKTKNQAELHVSYDSLDGYVTSLQRAIETPYPEYEAIGVRDGGELVQLNTNVLQIENEYYSFARPKRTTNRTEKPTVALRNRGVEYVEVRALDVNAFDPTGVSVDELRFMEAFLIFCLLENSPSISASEALAIEYNELTVALRGREPGVELQFNGVTRPLKKWLDEIFAGIEAVCSALDSGDGEHLFQQALDKQRDACADADRLPSSRTLEKMRATSLPFAKHTLAQSMQHERYFRDNPLPADKEQEFRELAEKSIADQEQLEKGDEIPFEDYLQRYFDETLG
jgi:glutamate--cysteine ligase